jgi:hypothetical protein
MVLVYSRLAEKSRQQLDMTRMARKVKIMILVLTEKKIRLISEKY